VSKFESKFALIENFCVFCEVCVRLKANIPEVSTGAASCKFRDFCEFCVSSLAIGYWPLTLLRRLFLLRTSAIQTSLIALGLASVGSFNIAFPFGRRPKGSTLTSAPAGVDLRFIIQH
jgi:hypothetical protein